MQGTRNKVRSTVYWIVPTALVVLAWWIANSPAMVRNPVAFVLIGLDGLPIEEAWITSVPTCRSNAKPHDTAPVIDDMFNVRFAERFSVYFGFPSDVTERPTHPQIGIRDYCLDSTMIIGLTEYEKRGEAIWLYKSDAIRHDLGVDLTVAVPNPRKIEVMYYAPWSGGVDISQFDGLEAWTVAQRLRVVQAVATPESTVLIVMYPRTLGVYKPSSASWLVVVTGQ